MRSLHESCFQWEVEVLKLSFQSCFHRKSIHCGNICFPVMSRPGLSQESIEFDEPDYALIDTLFSLAEAHLFMQLVELHDRDSSILPGNKTNADLYR